MTPRTARSHGGRHRPAVSAGSATPFHGSFPMAFLVLLASLLSPATPGAGVADNFEVVKDLIYFEGQDPDPERHRLDLYLPKGKKGFAVLVFAHGGGWKNGDKGQFAFLGETLAGHGVGVASVNYRLHCLS